MSGERRMIRFDPAKKLPGKTVAESMGIEVDAKAPGGQKVLGSVQGVGEWAGKRQYFDSEYEGVRDESGGAEVGFVVVLAVVALLVGLFVWLPAYSDCSERGGVLQEDALGLPGCVAGQPGG